MVEIRRRLKYAGIEYIVVSQPDGSFATLPAWMTEPEASRFEIVDGPPQFPLNILRVMRTEFDVLLSFLLTESKTETTDGGAQIDNSPTKSVRHKAAVRDAVSETNDRVTGRFGRSDARDRADAGQSQKRGGRQ
jgi:hypothetical protein